MTKNRTNLVFTKVFTFLGLKQTSMQVLFHFLLLLPKKFGQVMNFCKSTWANLIDTYFKFLKKNFINCGILACFGENMTKIGSLKAFFQI
jgi:hypothetical protein